MKILLIGSGNVGGAVKDLLSDEHEVIVASRKSKEYPVDLIDKSSLEALFAKTGPVDGVIVTGGMSVFKPLEDVADKDLENSWEGKLRGQMQVVLLGKKHVRDNGCIILTSGYVNRKPRKLSALPAMVDGAIEAFVACAEKEMPRGIRVNVVSPGLVAESAGPFHEDIKEGMPHVPRNTIAKHYLKVLKGSETGKTIEAWDL